MFFVFILSAFDPKEKAGSKWDCVYMYLWAVSYFSCTVSQNWTNMEDFTWRNQANSHSMWGPCRAKSHLLSQKGRRTFLSSKSTPFVFLKECFENVAFSSAWDSCFFPQHLFCYSNNTVVPWLSWLRSAIGEKSPSRNFLSYPVPILWVSVISLKNVNNHWKTTKERVENWTMK